MASEDIQTNIRIPSNLKDQLVSVADEAGRSLSAEITQRLEHSFRVDGLVDKVETEVKTLQAEMQAIRGHSEAALKMLDQTQAEKAQLAARLDVLTKSHDSEMAAALRMLNGEVAHWEKRAVAAERALEGQANLSPTIVRMERDIARLEVDKAAETLTLRVIATTLRPLLDSLPNEQVLEGILKGATVEDWKSVCDAYIANKIVRRPELDAAYDRLKDAEEALRKIAPEAADPIWEQIGIVRAAAGQEAAAEELIQEARKGPPLIRRRKPKS